MLFVKYATRFNIFIATYSMTAWQNQVERLEPSSWRKVGLFSSWLSGTDRFVNRKEKKSLKDLKTLKGSDFSFFESIMTEKEFEGISMDVWPDRMVLRNSFLRCWVKG